MEWLDILAHPSVTEKASTFLRLKYEMTVEDVYDFREYLEFENYLDDIKLKQQQKEHAKLKARR